MTQRVALVVHDEDKVLFIQRSESNETLPGAWALPSGLVEEGETVMQAAIREAKDRLGINIVANSELITLDIEEQEISLCHVSCSIAFGDPYIAEPDEMQKVEWMTFEKFYKKHADKNIDHGLRAIRHDHKFQKQFVKAAV